MQKFRICAAAAALALLCAAPVSAAEEGIRTVNAARQGSFRFDFSRDGEGFSPLIADYPVGSETFYELEVSRQAIPIDGAGCRLWLTGNNHSDDLFLGVSRCLEGLPAGLPCVFTIRVRIATNVDGGLIGIGGSPGSSVFVKCGITAAEPRREAVDGSYRLTLDKGNQGQDGPDMAIVGNLEKENGQRPGQYEWKSYRCRAMAVPGQDGKVYLSFGIDSGFERLSCYYLDSVDIAWEETQPLSRGRGHPDPVGESGPSHRGGGALPRHGEGRPLCRRAGLGPEPWHCPGLRRRQLPPGGEPQLAAGAVPPLPGHREPGGLLGAGAPRPGGLGAGRRRLGAGSGASAHPGAGRPCRPHSGGRVPADAPHGISGNRRGRGQISLSPGGFPEMGRQRRHRGGRRKGRKIPGRTGQGWPLQRGAEAVRTVQTRGYAAAMPPSRLCRDSSLCAKAPWPTGERAAT